MDRSKDKVTRFRRVNRRLKRFTVAHFADEHDVWVFTNRVLHSDFKVDDVLSDFTLVDQAFLFREHEFDRIFEREDMLVVVLINPVQHRRDRRGLAGTRHASEQHHSLAVLAEFVQNGGNVQLFKFWNEVINTSSDKTNVPHLRQNVDAETPTNAVDHAGVSKVRAPGVVVNLAVTLVHHREDEPIHFFVVDRSAIERAQRPFNTNVRGAIDLQMKVASR